LKQFHVMEIENHGMSLEEILLQAAETLKSKGIIKQSEPIVRQLLEREKLGGLGIPDAKLGFFHCRSDQVIRISFSLYPLSRPFLIKAMDEGMVEIDKLLFMLSPVSISREAVEVLSEISALLMEPETVKLLETHDQDLIRQYFVEKLTPFSLKKINTRE
jgi:mannitol operon transcriptional antiterminator